MQLDDLQKSAKDMTDDELRDKILKIRSDRRNFSRAEKKKVVKAKKEDNIDDGELQRLIIQFGGKENGA